MNYTNDIRDDSIFIILLIIFLTAMIVMAIYVGYIKPFAEKRKYIKMEISRTNDERHIMWKRELRKLYISQIPIVGKYISKNIR